MLIFRCKRISRILYVSQLVFYKDQTSTLVNFHFKEIKYNKLIKVSKMSFVRMDQSLGEFCHSI